MANKTYVYNCSGFYNDLKGKVNVNYKTLKRQSVFVTFIKRKKNISRLSRLVKKNRRTHNNICLKKKIPKVIQISCFSLLVVVVNCWQKFIQILLTTIRKLCRIFYFLLTPLRNKLEGLNNCFHLFSLLLYTNT